jgi:putative NIF3 family GTP cyclohydrolase 1 type 2
VLAALQAAHPYEEVAYDVYPVQQKNTRAGLGAMGTLDTPVALADFLERVATRLDAGSLRYVGDPASTIERVAVCGGSGSDFIGTALRQGADAYVTADVTYHTFFNALHPDGSPAMALIDPGHYETEALTEALLCDWLGERFPDVTFRRTQQRTSPMRHYTPGA